MYQRDRYGHFLCVAAAILAVEHIDFLQEVYFHEAYLSAQPPSPFQGAWFPSENGYFQRPQGSGPPPCKGPQGSVRLSADPWVKSQAE